MASITRDISKGQLLVYSFGQDAVAANQTDVQLPAMSAEEGGVTSGYEIPWDYDIVGVAFTLSAAGSAGSLTIGATVNGTEDTDTTIEAGTDAANYKRVPRGAARGTASSQLGCEITSDGSWNGTTSDLLVQVYILAYLEGI